MNFIENYPWVLHLVYVLQLAILIRRNLFYINGKFYRQRYYVLILYILCSITLMYHGFIFVSLFLIFNLYLIFIDIKDFRK